MSIFIHHGHSSLEIQQSASNKIDSLGLSALLEKLKSSDSTVQLHAESADPEQLLSETKGGFTWVEAAGGLIENLTGEVLMIYRRGAWDLPKGKIDPEETPERAAVREIAEETGLTHLTLVDDLSPTYHIYSWKSDWVLKKTHWFRYRCSVSQPLILQSEEDIEDAKWIKKDELGQYLDRIYPSLHPLIRSAMG